MNELNNIKQKRNKQLKNQVGEIGFMTFPEEGEVIGLVTLLSFSTDKTFEYSIEHPEIGNRFYKFVKPNPKKENFVSQTIPYREDQVGDEQILIKVKYKNTTDLFRGSIKTACYLSTVPDKDNSEIDFELCELIK